MGDKKKIEKKKKIILDEDVKKLVLARLRRVSSDTIITIGSDGEFSKEDLISCVEEENEIGELFAKAQMEWVTSFKEAAA